MISIDKIKEYTKCPQFGDKDYGKWGALRPEQREAYRYLIDIIEGMEKEIEILKAAIKAEKKISKLLPNETEFIIVRKEDYDRLFGGDKE